MRSMPLLAQILFLSNILALQGCIDVAFTEQDQPLKKHLTSSAPLSDNATGVQTAYIPMYFDPRSGNHYPYLDSVKASLPSARVVYIAMNLDPRTGNQTPVNQDIKIMSAPSTVAPAIQNSGFSGYNTIIYTPQSLNALAPAGGTTTRTSSSAGGW